jgi:hypothetical protein
LKASGVDSLASIVRFHTGFHEIAHRFGDDP